MKLETDYPVFHRMDDFGKLGFVAAELLMRHNKYDTETFKPQMGVVIHSCPVPWGPITSCTGHERENDDTEVFKRTVPNALCADIACRFKLGGEWAWFLQTVSYMNIFQDLLRMFQTDPELKTLLSGYVSVTVDMYRHSCVCWRIPQRQGKRLRPDGRAFCIELLRIH